MQGRLEVQVFVVEPVIGVAAIVVDDQRRVDVVVFGHGVGCGHDEGDRLKVGESICTLCPIWTSRTISLSS